MNSDTPSTESSGECKSACGCKAYPFLLFASTTIAAVFCFMYVTKPTNPVASPASAASVVITPPPQESEPVVHTTPPEAKLLPDPSKLPGDSDAPLTANPKDQPDQIHSEPNSPQP